MREKPAIKFFVNNKLWTYFVLMGLLFMPFSLVQSATNSNLQNLITEKNKINTEIKNKTKQAQEKNQQAQKLKDTLKKIDQDINYTQNKISDLGEEIAQKQQAIENTQKDIEQNEQQLNEENSKKNDTLRIIYENVDQNLLEILIMSDTLTEAIDKTQYLEALESKIESAITVIEQIKKELQEKKEQLNKEKSDLAQLKSNQEAYKKGLEQQEGEKKIVLEDVEAQKKKLEQQIDESKKLSNEVEAQIARIQAELSRSTNRTIMARDRGTSKIGFAWPMNYIYLSAYYGVQTPFQNFHTGLDMVNTLGTAVYASAAGTVVTVSDMVTSGHYYGYGKYVVIAHNARYSTLYAHLMAQSVSVGDEVKSGDIIGYMGNTGWTTGPHLHFEVWEYGSRQNPISYLP